MIVTVLTSTSERHNFLVNHLLNNNYKVNLIREVPQKNVAHGSKLVNNSLIQYFKKVKKSELKIFGNCILDHKRLLSLKEVEFEKISELKLENLESVVNSNFFVIFGTSFIKDPLISQLIDKKAINLHMGLSPFYRGAACNFWAQYDGNNSMIGGTIHYISKGLDSGRILKSITLENGEYDKFDAGMIAVKKTIENYVQLICRNEFNKAVLQDKSLEVRYTRKKEFTALHAKKFLVNYDKNSLLKV